jgi:hypothetical protein
MKRTETTTEYKLQGYVYEPNGDGIFWENLYTVTEDNWKAELRRMRKRWKSGRYRVVKYTTMTEVEIVSAKKNDPRVCIY